MNFYGELIYNGYTFKNYQIVSVGKNDPNKFGTSRELITDDGVDIPLFVKLTKKTQTISFDIVKVDNNRNVIAFTDKEKREFQRMLFVKDSYGTLQMKDKGVYVFYGAFVGDTTETYLGGISYISLEFQLASPYCYSSIITEEHRVIGEKIIEINNKSNASEKLNIDIKVDMFSGNDIEIRNLATTNIMTLNGLDDYEKIYIYGDTKEFISLNNSDKNIFKLSNRDVISLNYGINRLKIKAKDSKITFMYQFEFQLF